MKALVLGHEHGDEWGVIDTQDVKVIGNIYENPDLASK